MSKECLIKKMPDKCVLGAFVAGQQETPRVVFNIEEGSFEIVGQVKQKDGELLAEMPDKTTLEEFLIVHDGQIRAVYNCETRRIERL